MRGGGEAKNRGAVLVRVILFRSSIIKRESSVDRQEEGGAFFRKKRNRPWIREGEVFN
jgi:hypothetical protein